MASATVSYEQCGELKFGQVGIANLRIRTLDIAALKNEMQERVERAPKQRRRRRWRSVGGRVAPRSLSF